MVDSTSTPLVVEKARAAIIHDHPFFATVMLKKPFEKSSSVSTLCVSADGRVTYNPKFVETLSVRQMVFAICHELMHYLGDHHSRYVKFAKARGLSQSRKLQTLANIAGDYWINDTLSRSSVGELIPGCLTKPGAADKTFEELLAELLDDANDDSGSDSDSDDSGDSDSDSSHNGIGRDIDFDSTPDAGAKLDALAAERKIEIAYAAQIAKAKGRLSAALSKFAATAIESKTPWYDVLERYMTSMVAYETSWSKPNRRYAPSYYLPSTSRSPSMGTVVLQVDVSGSISKIELDHYSGHIKRILEQCAPQEIHVLYTDTSVCRHDVFYDADDVEITAYSGGGTRMEAGFEYLSAKGIVPDVCITFTDGMDVYKTPPDFPVVWCCSSAAPIPYGNVVRFELV